jgi:hypothetical protein
LEPLDGIADAIVITHIVILIVTNSARKPCVAGKLDIEADKLDATADRDRQEFLSTGCNKCNRSNIWRFVSSKPLLGQDFGHG